jgi:hypothetical protein
VYLTQHTAGNRPGQSLPAPATHEPATQPPRVPEPAAPRPADDNELVARLYSERRSNVVVEVAGQVERTLRDDTQGNPHQRFVVRLSPDLALLVAHNTSLAPRVPLQRGSAVRIRGEYEWSAQGGVLHWTHRDPRRRHQDGWIELDGRRYQ